MKRTAIAALVSALVFGFLATWLGPQMIAYWYAPPVPSSGAAAFNCTNEVKWAMGKLVMTQIIGTLIGAAIGLIIGFLLGRRDHVPAPPLPVTPAVTPSSTSKRP